MTIDKKDLIVIPGYPGYYIAETAGYEDDVEIRLRIFLKKDTGDFKELIASPGGKILMKNERGTPQPFLYADVLEKVKEARDAGATKTAENLPDEHEELIKRRKALAAIHTEILFRVKSAPTIKLALVHKEACEKAEAALDAFDKEYPAYAKGAKLKRSESANRKEEYNKIISDPEFLKLAGEITELRVKYEELQLKISKLKKDEASLARKYR